MNNNTINSTVSVARQLSDKGYINSNDPGAAA